MKKYPLALALLLSIALPAHADDDWVALGSPQAQSKYTLYLNAKTFQRQGAVVNATVRYAYKEAQVFPFLNIKYDAKETLAYYECAERRIVTAKNDFTMDKKVVHTINLTAPNPFAPGKSVYDPQPVSPGTPEEELFNAVCKYGQDKK